VVIRAKMDGVVVDLVMEVVHVRDKLGRKFCLLGDGTERIAVVPGQCFANSRGPLVISALVASTREVEEVSRGVAACDPATWKGELDNEAPSYARSRQVTHLRLDSRRCV
jgi:hypothetical protein